MCKATLVVNFFGSPGVGKSTISAQTFSTLKAKRVSCELVNEYAKTCVWENSLNTLEDQIYVFGRQQHKQRVLRGKVRVIITDSPLPLCICYDLEKDKTLQKLVLKTYNSYNNINFLLIKNFEGYESVGRKHDSEESDKIHKKIVKLLKKHKIETIPVKVGTIFDFNDAVIKPILAEVARLRANE